jgi:WD40 repeat protein
MVESGVRFSDNSKWLASISSLELSVWDVEAGILRLYLDLHAYCPSNRFSGSSSFIWERSAIPIWDTTTGELVEKLPLGLDELFGTVCALSSGSKFLARKINHSQVQITSSLTGDVIHSLQGFVDEIVVIVFSPNSEYLALYYGRGFAQIWHITADDAILMPNTYYNVGPVAFSHDSKLVSFGYKDGSVRVWDLEDGIELQLHTGHIEPVNWVAFSKDSRFLATASNDWTVKLWTTTTAKQDLPVKHYGLEEKIIALSDDGKLTATGNKRGVIEVWDKHSSRPLERFEVQNVIEALPLLAFSRDCKFLAIAAVRTHCSLFIDVRTLGGGPNPGFRVPEDLNVGETCLPTPLSIAFSPDSTCITVAYRSPNQSSSMDISVWDTHKGEWVQTLRCQLPYVPQYDSTYRLYLSETNIYLHNGTSSFKSAKKNSESGQLYGPFERITERSDYPPIGYSFESDTGWVSWNGKT